MIIFPQSLVLSAALTATPLTYPRIGYNNLARGLSASAVTVSTETADGPKDAPLRPDTAEAWAASALPATWTVDLGSAQSIDYVGIAGHTLGSCAAAVALALDSDATLPAPYLSSPGSTGNYASTPDSAGNSITGDIDIRAQVAATDYTPAANDTLIAKWNPTGNQRIWSFDIETTGNLILRTTADGSTVRTHTSSAATAVTDGTTKWLRATRAASTGVVKFYTSTDGVTYAQLGTDVAGTVEGIFDGTAPIEIGSNSLGTANPFDGRVYYAEVRNGIGGAVVVQCDPSEGEDGALTWVSGLGETWTVNTSGAPPVERLTHNAFATAYAPADDAPLMFLDTARVGRYLRVTVTGAGAIPRIASIYVGSVLAMEKQMANPFAPLNMARETVLNQSLSRGGQFLGQGFRRNGVMSSVGFKSLTAAWVRSYFDPFSRSARSRPYFFSWNPQDYPQEVGYVWTDKDIVPAYSGEIVFGMEVSWSMKGVGAA